MAGMQSIEGKRQDYVISLIEQNCGLESLSVGHNNPYPVPSPRMVVCTCLPGSGSDEGLAKDCLTNLDKGFDYALCCLFAARRPRSIGITSLFTLAIYEDNHELAASKLRACNVRQPEHVRGATDVRIPRWRIDSSRLSGLRVV